MASYPFSDDPSNASPVIKQPTPSHTSPHFDRFIPNRTTSNFDNIRIQLPSESQVNEAYLFEEKHGKSHGEWIYDETLKNEFIKNQSPHKSSKVFSFYSMPSVSTSPQQVSSTIFSENEINNTPRRRKLVSPNFQQENTSHSITTHSSPFSVQNYPFTKYSSNHSIISWQEESQSTISPTKRKISTQPVKVLDAPQLQDDFYLNILDWSKSNIIAIALYNTVYLYNVSNGSISQLFPTCTTFQQKEVNLELITCVNWSGNGHYLAVGYNNGSTIIFDSCTLKPITTLKGHSVRVGCIAWNNSELLCTASRDATIVQYDLRTWQQKISNTLTQHTEEICSVTYSPDGKYIASGGNDNQVLIWSTVSHSTIPLFQCSEHSAAIKALRWNPHCSGVIVSGGGTADRCIRVWDISLQTAKKENTTHSSVSTQTNPSSSLTMHLSSIHCVDTGSQVCQLQFSPHCNELITSHGYGQYQLAVWNYSKMSTIAEWKAHSQHRVLYMALSPNGSQIATAAGDETVALWNIWQHQCKEQQLPSILSEQSLNYR